MKRIKIEPLQYIVRWYVIDNPSVNGQSQVPMSFTDAEAWADYGNKRYPEIKHKVVEVE